MFDFLKGKKLIIVGALTAIVPLLEKFDITKFEQFIPDQYEPLIVSVVGVLVVALRLVTNTAPLKKA